MDVRIETVERLLVSLQDVMQDYANTQSWFYRGEGNDTIVVAVKSHNLVLRLKKKSRDTTARDLYEADSTALQRILNSLDFIRKVFLPLMSGRNVRVGHVVQLPLGFAEKLDKLCESSRPKGRLHKAIDAEASFAVLMPDFCFLPRDVPWTADCLDDLSIPINANGNPTFSLEIKPKCGFLPSSPFIKDAHSIKHTVCYYCMLQGVKVDEGKYSRQSKYCPVNLLSGDTKRVFYALQTLVSDPQNNLRIFKDGCPIFNDEILAAAMSDPNKVMCCPILVLEEALKDTGWKVHAHKGSSHKCDVTLGPYSKSFMQTVLQIFIDDSKSSEQYTSRLETIAKSEVCKGNGLMHGFSSNETLQNMGAFGCGGVLKRLSQVQRMDDFDVEALYPLYLKVKDYFETNSGTREELSVDGPYNADIWKELTTNPGSDSLQGKPLEMWTIKDIVFKLCQLSVASTAKDCSVLLAFQPQATKPKHLPYIEVGNSCDINGPKPIIAYNIGLVDLDPKEFDRVQKYFKDSCNTVQHFIQNNANNKLPQMWW